MKTGCSWRASAPVPWGRRSSGTRITCASGGPLLAQTPLLAALLRFRTLLKAFATHHGVPGLYNETVTCFYMLLIREHMERMGGAHAWERFKEMNPELFSYPKALLESYYPGGAAFSEQAKQAFLLPEALTAKAA